MISQSRCIPDSTAAVNCAARTLNIAARRHSFFKHSYPYPSAKECEILMKVGNIKYEIGIKTSSAKEAKMSTNSGIKAYAYDTHEDKRGPISEKSRVTTTTRHPKERLKQSRVRARRRQPQRRSSWKWSSRRRHRSRSCCWRS